MLDLKYRHYCNEYENKENKYCYECPPGFIPGRIKKVLKIL